MDAVYLENLFDELFPICRSISGDGLRQSLNIISKRIPLEIIEYPTGKQCFDWEIPDEWNIKNAYIKKTNGETVVDFENSNLHVVGYSTPINDRISNKELKKHLHYTTENPDAIPFVTSYYNRTWGFCLPYSLFKSLNDPEYDVFIDSSHKPGSVTAGRFQVKGQSIKELLLFTHIGHPSMANDQLSGPITLVAVADWLYKNRNILKYSYTVLFAPETVGSIAYIHENQECLKNNCIGGYTAACTADKGPFNYRTSRHRSAITDFAMINALKTSNTKYQIHEFSPIGCDERHFNSHGIGVEMGSIMRAIPGTYNGYHTSLDNKDFINFDKLIESSELIINAIMNAEADAVVTARHKNCEPKLDKYGLYPTLSDKNKNMETAQKLISIWAYSDGGRLSEIADKLEITTFEARHLAEKLAQKNIIAIEDISW